MGHTRLALIYTLSLHDALPISLIESHGYIEDGERKGDYPEMLQQLDRLAREFAEEFNKVHQAGANLEDEEARDFFVDRKSTRLNSSHVASSYAVFCLKKKSTLS